MVRYKQLQRGGLKRRVRKLANKITMKGEMDTSRIMVCLKNYNHDLGGPAHNAFYVRPLTPCCRYFVCIGAS